MLLHVIKYRLKCMLREKTIVFWVLLFPIILSTFFNLAFSKILDGEEFEKVDTAIINSDEASAEFMASVEESGMFNIHIVSEAEALDLLAEGKISGYIEYGEEIKLTVAKSGMNESMIKTFLDRYAQITSSITNVITNNPELMNTNFINEMDLSKQYTKERPLGSSTNIVVIYFYTLIAMTCLMSASMGVFDVINIQANQSDNAARVNVAPVHKLKIFIGYVISSVLFSFLSVVLVLLYTSKVLDVDYGNRVGHILLLCFVSCVTGELLGTMVSALVKKSEGIKSAIVLSVIMAGCFLAGMMIIDMKYLVQEKAPIVAYLNPSNLITDGLYALYYYEGLERYFLNLGILTGLSLIFGTVTYVVLRRQKYASL